MSWDTAVQDVRFGLNDGPADKLRWMKKLLGIVNGTNLIFKTFEDKRVTNFTTPTGVEGVYVDGVVVTVATDDPVSGQFTLQGTAPTEGADVSANYYVQWFTDAALQGFLTSAVEWINGTQDFTQVTPDLQPAAKEYAMALAYQTLAAKFATNLSEEYQLRDAPDEKRFNPATQFMSIAKQKFDLAFKLRNDVYDGRKGMAGAPRSGVVRGCVTDVAPNR